jgi:DNA-binding NarL/FixJ family response regulator
MCYCIAPNKVPTCNMMQKITIGIVDDKSQNRISIKEQLQYCDEVELVLTATNGVDFIEQLNNTPLDKHPHVVLMDIEMPEMDGIQAVQHSHLMFPEIKFLMLTVFDDDDKIFEAIKAGANGYLLKDEKISIIIDYIQQVVELGGAPMSPRIARKAMNLLMHANIPETVATSKEDLQSVYELSDREVEVLKFVVDGLDYKSIAQKIYLSTHTVRKHIANIYTKLHVTSKAQAIKLVASGKL